MFVRLNQPFISKHDFNYRQGIITVANRSYISFGITMHLLSDFGSSTENEVEMRIIQEPISIPVIDLVIEEPEEPVIEDKITSLSAESHVEPIEQEEPLGWFAWLIEFIAGLFRF